MTLLENKTLQLYTEFVSNNGVLPKYAKCEILFHGEETYHEDVIALYSNPNGNSNDPNDEKICFYCESIVHLLTLLPRVTSFADVYAFNDDDKQALFATNEDFVVLRVVEFFEYLDNDEKIMGYVRILQDKLDYINKQESDLRIATKSILRDALKLFLSKYGTETIYFPDDDAPCVEYSIPDEDNADCSIREMHINEDGTIDSLRLYSYYNQEEYTTDPSYVYNADEGTLAEYVLAQVENGKYEPEN